MDAIVSTLTDSNVTALVNALQILSVVVIVRLYFRVSHISKHYTSIARIPEHQKSLRQRASRINDYLNDYDVNKLNLDAEIVRLGAALRSLRRKLPWSERGSTKRALGAVGNYEDDRVEAKARAVYLEVQKIIAELEEQERDKRWRQP